MPSKHSSPAATTSKGLFHCLHALKTHFTHCHHLENPFQLPTCPQNTSHQLPSPPNPFSTVPIPSKHASPSVIPSNLLFNCPHARKTHFTRCHHLEPPFQMPPCCQSTFHLLPPPPTPCSTAPMHSKHISPGATTSNPLFNCPDAPETRFTQCHHLQALFELPPCPSNRFHPVPLPPKAFSTAPMPSNHISPSATTSIPLFNCPHALKTHFTQGHHLQPPF